MHTIWPARVVIRNVCQLGKNFAFSHSKNLLIFNVSFSSFVVDSAAVSKEGRSIRSISINIEIRTVHKDHVHSRTFAIRSKQLQLQRVCVGTVKNM